MAKIIIWKNWICLFIIENIKEINYCKGPGTPGPPQTILIIMFCGLVAKIVIWDWWICLFPIEHTRGIAYPKNPGTLRSPQTKVIIIFWGLVAKIITWENWFCLFIIEIAQKLAYPKGPGTFGICNFQCTLNYNQTNSILPNDNPNHQSPKYNNKYILGDPGSGNPWDVQFPL